jgi:type I restriction enzyme S subunit
MRGLKEVFARFEAEGTVFGSIGQEDFRAIPCVIVPSRLVEVFDMLASPLDSRIEANELQSHTLVSLRDASLPRFVSGAIRLTNAPHKSSKS